MKIQIDENTKQTIFAIGIVAATITTVLITRNELSLLGLFFLLLVAD